MSGIVAQNLNKHTGLIKAPGGGGAWNFISKTTISSDATISFTSGLDSTYREYMFYFVDIHPATDNTLFTFNVSIDGGSNYNVTKTTFLYYARHKENGTAYGFGTDAGNNLDQNTGFKTLYFDTGNDNDQAAGGYLHLFNPSSTTFAKKFLSNFASSGENDWAYHTYGSGIINTTSAINAIQFKSSSGNVDAGSIFLHGLTT